MYHLPMLDDKIVEDLLGKMTALTDAPPEVAEHLVLRGGRDEATGPVREILTGDRWFVVDSLLWEGWTGLRRLNGVEHHGPIKYLDSPIGSPIMYSGKRTCGCRVCEVSVPPSLRKN